MALKTVTGKIQNPDGTVPANAEVTFTLSQAAYIPGTQEVPPTVVRPSTIAADGSYSVSLQANNDLTPNGTYYTYTLRIGNALPVVLTLVVPQTAGPFVLTQILSNPPALSASPSHVSTLTVDGTATFTAGPVIIGADPGGGQLLRVGGTGHFSGVLTLDNNLVMTAAGGSVILPSLAGFAVNNNANTASNLFISDAGAATIRAGLTINAGGLINLGATLTQRGAGIGAGTINADFQGSDALSKFRIYDDGHWSSAQGGTVTAGGLTVNAGGILAQPGVGVAAFSAGSANLGISNPRFIFYDDLTNASYVSYDISAISYFRSTSDYIWQMVPTGATRFSAAGTTVMRLGMANGRFQLGLTSPGLYHNIDSVLGQTVVFRLRQGDFPRYRSDWSMTSAGLTVNAFDDTGGVGLPIILSGLGVTITNSGTGTAGDISATLGSATSYLRLISGANQLRLSPADAANTIYNGGADMTLSSGGALKIFGATQGVLVGATAAALIGFYNTAPVVKQTVTGSKAANAALTSLMAALVAMGLVTDTTT